VWSKIYIYNFIVQFRILTLLSFMVIMYHYSVVEVSNINLNNGNYICIFLRLRTKCKVWRWQRNNQKPRFEKDKQENGQRKNTTTTTQNTVQKKQNWSNANPENSVPCRVNSSCSTSAKLCWTTLTSCYDNRYNKWKTNTIQSNIKYQNRRKGYNRYY